MKIRIKFQKQGAMKFIGHLDVMRYFQKAMRRAEVAIRYSGGFSPHQIMSFAAPLGVGITSLGEYLDIEVTETEASQTMVERLNATMAEGFAVTSWRLLPEDAGNAMAIVAAADYRLTFRPGYEPEEGAAEWFAGFSRFFDKPSVVVSKKTKRGEAQIDLRPLIYELRSEETDGESSLFLKLSTGSVANIKPELLLDAYYGSLGLERPLFAFMTERCEVYADLAGEEERESGVHRFTPLEALGEELAERRVEEKKETVAASDAEPVPEQEETL